MPALEHPEYHAAGPTEALLLGIVRELTAIHGLLESLVQPASSTDAAKPAQPASQGKRAPLPKK